MNPSSLVIKQQKSRLWYISTGISLLLLFIGAFVVGRYLALADLNTTKAALVSSQQKLIETQLQLNNATENLVMQKQSSQVDNLSNKELVNSVKSMQQTQKELEEELIFYRKIMAPEMEKEGLTIDSLKISRTDKNNEYHFKTSLIQAGKQSQFIKGRINLKLIGTLNGTAKEYDFRELGTFNTKHFQFQFKYFQNIEGIINLPEGFEVQKISANAQTSGLRRNQKADKQINWQP